VELWISMKSDVRGCKEMDCDLLRCLTVKHTVLLFYNDYKIGHLVRHIKLKCFIMSQKCRIFGPTLKPSRLDLMSRLSIEL